MVKVPESGVWLLNGQTLIADDAQAAAKIRQQAGVDADRQAAAAQTMAYGILTAHNTSGDDKKLKIKYYYGLLAKSIIHIRKYVLHIKKMIISQLC